MPALNFGVWDEEGTNVRSEPPVSNATKFLALPGQDGL